MTRLPAADADSPEYAHPEPNRLPVDAFPSAMQPIPQSRMFTLKADLGTYRQRAGRDAPVFDASQGDGGASLPGVPLEILSRASELQIARGTRYTPPCGTQEFREATAERYWRLSGEHGWGPQNIIFTQGGRDGLLKAYDAMIALGHGRIGDLLVVSRVPWISYNWGPYGLGLNVLRAPGRADEGWSYSPQSIEACVAFARRDGREVAGLVITSPDNPTGRTTPIEEQIRLAEAALAAGCAFVLFDWMYHRITGGEPCDINRVLLSFPAEAREQLIFLDGITKSLGASNIRSAHLVAGERVIRHITSRASHGVIPSFFAEAVAVAAYEAGFEKAAATIVGPTLRSRAVLDEILTGAGVRFLIGDGYYALIDVSAPLGSSRFEDTAELGSYLAREHGLLVVPGAYFSPAAERWIRFSYAAEPEETRRNAERLLHTLAALPSA